MNFGFTRRASLNAPLPLNEAFENSVAAEILSRYDVVYTCVMNRNGFLLKPKLRFTLWRNSFWPEVKGEVSAQDSGAVLQLTCRPTKFVCRFFALFLIFALLIEIGCGGSIFANGIDSLPLSLLVPVFLCLFAYLLIWSGCAICAKIIIKTIESVLI